MGRFFWHWVSWFVFLFLLDFIIPFKFLNDVPKLTGSFLFWVVWIVVAIISIFSIILQWQDKK
jgi:hypothetical protein